MIAKLLFCIKIFPGSYMGWGLGSNDSANVFGPQVHSGIIKYRWATILTAFFVMLGAVLEGGKCFDHIGKIAQMQDIADVPAWLPAFAALLGAALMINIMSYMTIPVSTSEAIVGALIGVGFLFNTPINGHAVVKSLICWMINPVLAAVVSFALYHFLSFIWVKRVKNVIVFNWMVKISSIVIGCYAAYTLGANNLANAVGPYVGVGLLTGLQAKLLGGAAIAIGVLTYSRKVMETVGKGIVALDPFSALVAILTEAGALHFFAQLGVPISSSQAIVGAVVGVGIIKGAKAVSFRKVIHIVIGWFGNVAGAGIAAYLVGLAMLQIL